MKNTVRKICFFVAIFLVSVCALTACDEYDEKEEIKGFLSGAQSEAEKFLEGIFSDYESPEGYDIDAAMVFEQDIAVESGSVDRKLENMNASALSVQIGGAALEVLVAEDEALRLVTENAGKFQVYQKDDKCYIKAVGSTEINVGDSRIYLYLPAKEYFREVDLEVGAGQIKLKGLQADKVKASVGAGDIRLADMEMGSLEVSVGMGNFVASGTITQGAKAECSMGNLELIMNGPESAYDYALSCVAGSIKIGTEQYGGSVTREQKINNDAGRLLDLKCSMGNMIVTFK